MHELERVRFTVAPLQITVPHDGKVREGDPRQPMILACPIKVKRRRQAVDDIAGRIPESAAQSTTAPARKRRRSGIERLQTYLIELSSAERALFITGHGQSDLNRGREVYLFRRHPLPVRAIRRTIA